MLSPIPNSNVPSLPTKEEMKKNEIVKALKDAKNGKRGDAIWQMFIKIQTICNSVSELAEVHQFKVLKMFKNESYFIALCWCFETQQFLVMRFNNDKRELMWETIYELYGLNILLNGEYYIYTPKRELFINAKDIRKNECMVIKLVRDDPVDYFSDQIGGYYEPRHPNYDFEVIEGRNEYVNKHLINNK